MANGGWVATHQDVTEAKHREESFRLLFEGNPVPMWVIDRETLRFLASRGPSPITAIPASNSWR
jgi:hypothetical protein